MTPQTAPVQGVPAKTAAAGPQPVKGAPPDLFTALLGAAATGLGPPGPAPAPARTAPAEGTPAEGDSSGHTDSQTTTAPAAAALIAEAIAPTAACPAAPSTTPAGGRRVPVPAPIHGSPAAGTTLAPRVTAHQEIAPVAPAPQQPAEPAAGFQQPARLHLPGQAPATSAAPAPRGTRAHAGSQQRQQRGSVPTLPDVHAARAATPGHAPAEPRMRAARATHASGTATPAPDGRATAAAPAGSAHEGAKAAAQPGTDLPRARVHELAESMHALVKVATRRGRAAAKITLRPAELGGVQVRLRAHAGGVSASLTAQTAAGAQALGVAHGELRRALEAQGIVVHAIDVQLAGDGPGPDGRAQQWQAGTGSSPGRHGGGEDDAEVEPDQTIEPSRLPPAAGEVDVLA